MPEIKIRSAVLSRYNDLKIAVASGLDAGPMEIELELVSAELFAVRALMGYFPDSGDICGPWLSSS
jgi:hypothetical protein